MAKLNWLGRSTVSAPYLTLCLTEPEYLAAAKHCNIEHPDSWLDIDRHKACMHAWTQRDKLTCVVCVHPDATKPDTDPIDVAASLMHEAVHVFQRLCDSIGEDHPSREFEAYSIERIAEELLREFARRRNPRRSSLTEPVQ